MVQIKLSVAFVLAAAAIAPAVSQPIGSAFSRKFQAREVEPTHPHHHHHHHHHHKQVPAVDATAGDPNAGTPAGAGAPVPREIDGAPHHHGHRHREGGHRHHRQAPPADATTVDPNAGAPVTREVDGAPHHHGHRHREGGHRHHKQAPPADATTVDPNAGAPAAREYLDDGEMFGRSFDDFDLDARDLYLD